MALYINGNKTGGGGGGNADVVHLTQAEYDALPPTKLTDDKVYMITDANGDGSQFQPVIYSEDEREIGVWTDGKPLYQKTLDFGTVSATKEVDVSSLNIDTFVNSKIRIQGSVFQFADTVANDKRLLQVYFDTENDRLGLDISNFSSYTANNIFITIQYTKTTDTAGSGTWTPQGVPAVHYSTDEQVVGTWIDGSTIYQRTIHLTSGSIGSSHELVITTGLSGVDRIIEKTASVHDISEDRDYHLPYLRLTYNESILFQCFVASDNSVNISLLSNTQYSFSDIDITLQYTKTS